MHQRLLNSSLPSLSMITLPGSFQNCTRIDWLQGPIVGVLHYAGELLDIGLGYTDGELHAQPQDPFKKIRCDPSVPSSNGLSAN